MDRRYLSNKTNQTHKEMSS